MSKLQPQPTIATPKHAEPASTRDEHVVACAAELFLERGIESVKMVDIAEAAGVGVATLYRHFSTKLNLAVASATLLWGRYNEQLRAVVESQEFAPMSGLERLRTLLEGYCYMYAQHADFVAFLDEFDHLALSGQLERSQLEEYGARLESFYPVFEDAYLLGRADGSIGREVDCRLFYQSLAHAIMGVAEKLNRGEVIPTDDFSSGSDELQCLVNMAIWSLAARDDVEVPAAARRKG